MVKKKVLLIRLDKIGDLICTLPCDEVLDENIYDVTWVVQKGMGQVVDLGQKKRRYIELDKNNPSEAAAVLNNYLEFSHFHYAISFQCPWWLNFELFKARIRVRSGVKSQWHSFLFLNKGLRQRRSLAEKHELEYNLDLMYETFQIRATKEFHYFHIATPIDIGLYEKWRLRAREYVVVHPGMMGSARNWPQSKYISYIQSLIDEKKQIVITGTEQDEKYLTEIKKKYLNHSQVLWLQSKLKMNELIQVLAYAEFVVAPSTGVAHLAASLGAEVKGIYSPVTVHHPKRWGPRGPNVEIWMIELPRPR